MDISVRPPVQGEGSKAFRPGTVITRCWRRYIILAPAWDSRTCRGPVFRLLPPSCRSGPKSSLRAFSCRDLSSVDWHGRGVTGALPICSLAIRAYPGHSGAWADLCRCKNGLLVSGQGRLLGLFRARPWAHPTRPAGLGNGLAGYATLTHKLGGGAWARPFRKCSGTCMVRFSCCSLSSVL